MDKGLILLQAFSRRRRMGDPLDTRDPLLHVNNMITENPKLKYYFSEMCPQEFQQYTTSQALGNCLDKRSQRRRASKDKNINRNERIGDIDFCIEQSVSLRKIITIIILFL